MSKKIRKEIKEINFRLREIRINLHIDKEEMANTLNIGIDTYNKIERGHVELTTDKYVILKKKYNVDLNYLITGEKIEVNTKYLLANNDLDKSHECSMEFFDFLKETMERDFGKMK